MLVPETFCYELNMSRINIFILLFQVKPLIWVESVIERHAHSRIEFMIKVKFKEHVTKNPTDLSSKTIYNMTFNPPHQNFYCISSI